MVKPGPRRSGKKAPLQGSGSRHRRLTERSSPVLRLSSPVSCPSSLVSRPKVGNPMGAEPSWSSGRESRGDRLEIGPLWRFLFPVSFPLKETGSRRSAKSPRPVFVPAAAGDSPSVLRIRRSPVLFVLPVPSPPAAYFLDVEKVGKDTPKGTYPEGGSLWNPSPSARGLRPP